MTSATKRYIQDKIKARESKLLEEERVKEEARLAEIERNKPLVTREDLKEAIESISNDSSSRLEKILTSDRLHRDTDTSERKKEQEEMKTYVKELLQW